MKVALLVHIQLTMLRIQIQLLHHSAHNHIVHLIIYGDHDIN